MTCQHHLETKAANV